MSFDGIDSDGVAAIDGYHQLFDVSPEIPIIQQSIVNYQDNDVATLGFHFNDVNGERQLHYHTSPRCVLPNAISEGMLATYRRLPSTLSENADWPEQYALIDETKETIARFLSIGFIRSMRLQKECTLGRRSEAEPGLVPEILWVLNRLNNIIYLAVDFTDEFIPGTILQRVKQIFIVSDRLRAAVFH